jgi:hypothetical protein
MGKPISNTAYGKPVRPVLEFRHFAACDAATPPFGTAFSGTIITTIGKMVIRSCAKWPLVQFEPTLI